MNDQEIETISNDISNSVFRTNLAAPGFCVITLGTKYTSAGFKQLLIQFTDNMDKLFYKQYGKSLSYIATGNYDQQESTKFHLDGGPEESFLLLGYEPTEVEYQIKIADYSKAAIELGINSKQFVEEYNPIFISGEQKLIPYTNDLTLDTNEFNIVAINNSCSSGDNEQLGVLHKATIAKKLIGKKRVIYSIQIGVTNGLNVSNDKENQEKFLKSEAISRKPYE